MFATSLFCLAAAAAATSVEHGPFSSDFVSFLGKNSDRNEYALNAFKEYGTTGTFGGKITKNEKINNAPVVFVHGNSDSALYHSEMASGWTKSVEHFKENGYTSAELYGLTYGSRDINLSLQSRITCRILLGTRRFFESILEYTEVDKINVIAHSMGVTIARKAIQGGHVELFDESCSLGESLSDRVDTLVAISGANYGMCMCLMAGIQVTPACGQAGFAPSLFDLGNMGACMEENSSSEDIEYAQVLKSTNERDEKEADFVVSLWSNDDPILGKNNLVWGRKTSLVPGSDLTHAYAGLNHFQSKDETVRDQVNLVRKHSLHGGRAKRHHH